MLWSKNKQWILVSVSYCILNIYFNSISIISVLFLLFIYTLAHIIRYSVQNVIYMFLFLNICLLCINDFFFSLCCVISIIFFFFLLRRIIVDNYVTNDILKLNFFFIFFCWSMYLTSSYFSQLISKSVHHLYVVT